MAHKKAARHDANASGKLELAVFFRGQLVQMVVDLQRRLGEQRAQVDREREPVAIHRDTAKSEREAVSQVNHQLLTQIKIKVLRKAQRDIELSTRETQVDTPSEVHQHPTAPADLRFKLNKMRYKVTSPHGDPESHRADCSQKRAMGHMAQPVF